VTDRIAERGLLSSCIVMGAVLLSACVSDSTETLVAQSESLNNDQLAEAFINPPQSARPRVWWHWMNGNVTQEGIAKDLEWMSSVGIGGLQNFDANLATPQIVDQRLVYMEPDWQAAFRFAGTQAESLGLELAIAASPGWSETGGPWVPNADGLKKLVWSAITVDGGQPVSEVLPHPPMVTGPFQNIGKQPGISELMGAGDTFRPESETLTPQYYADVRVLAFPATAVTALPEPTYTLSSGQTGDWSAISDGDLTTTASLSRQGLDAPLELYIDYDVPQTVRSARVFMPGASAMFLGALVKPVLEVSEDRIAWRAITDLAVMPVQTTHNFAPITARHFRVVFRPGDFGAAVSSIGRASEGVAMSGPSAGFRGVGSAPLNIAELVLSADVKIDQFEAKAGFEIEKDYYHLGGVDDAVVGVNPDAVIDLSDRVSADGVLDWTPPPGRWTILRLGYSLLGTTNHPATPEATGLEVDKYDGAAVRRYLEHYLDLYADTLGSPLAEQDFLDAILTDSIEVGAANWTPAMIEQFKALRGYDPTPWLPALTGVVMGDREQSDAFLYDFRRTLADLLSREHYGTVAEVAHEHGLLVYGEALENGRPSLGDDLTMRSYADIPMSAMWTHSREAGPNFAHVNDMKGAASVAHIYGRRYVAAESMTSAMAPWDHVPSYLKRIIDLEFVNGVNRPVIHTSVHQPVDDKVPGLSLFIFGQYFNRHDTWAPLARPWVDYLSRSSLMLQQGRNVADVAYFYGEDAPPAALYQDADVPDAPTHYAWNFMSADAIIDQLSVDAAGSLVTPGGARYRVLYLGGTSEVMTMPVLRRLAELVRAGATVVGAQPVRTPSLADDAQAFADLAAALWGGDTGLGRVVASQDIESALFELGVTPAIQLANGETSPLAFVEREWPEGRLFYLSNPTAETLSLQVRLRVEGQKPELWDPVSGAMRALSYDIAEGGTDISLNLASDDAVFVVFREATEQLSYEVPAPVMSPPVVIETPWSVSFQEGRRGPDTLSMTALSPWQDSDDPALKYFSGIADYSNTFATPDDWQADQPLWLDLGEAYDVAEVWVNERRVGGLWRAPWRIDVGAFVQLGANSLTIRIANRWVNRLVGDAQEGADVGTFTTLPTYRPDATLRPSGLLGPVSISVELNQN
jgi:hypothetical protein